MNFTILNNISWLTKLQQLFDYVLTVFIKKLIYIWILFLYLYIYVHFTYLIHFQKYNVIFICIGTNISTGEEVAIKLECIKTRHPQLHIESKIYKMLLRARKLKINLYFYFSNSIYLNFLYFSWNTYNKMVWFRGRLQCNGNGITWSIIRGPFQFLFQKIFYKNCTTFSWPIGNCFLI